MPLAQYPSQESRLVVGLISGTSADGIDAAAVRFPGADDQGSLEIVDFRSLPYPAEIREQVMLAAADRLSMRQTAVLGTRLGHLFAEAALAVIPDGARCDLIASHGQTVCHLPAEATTLQIGESAVIAERTGVTTISDFRTADMACGGQGAPLVPLFDAHVLAHPSLLRIAVNLGGIANITVIPPGAPSERITAWDTGPANCVSDALCRLNGLGDYDAGGALAGSGKVASELLERLLLHPYFSKPGPKSTGLEDFGEQFARELQGGESTKDLLRTVMALSAQSLVDDLVRVQLAQRHEGVELVFAGGGTANAVLMLEIRERLGAELQALGQPAATLRSFAEFGIPEEGREAAAFAYLGDRTARGLVGAAPGATGARNAALLGKVSFPSRLARG